MVNMKDSMGILEYMAKMLSPDQLVYINKPNHLPIMLLHRKFYNTDYNQKQT